MNQKRLDIFLFLIGIGTLFPGLLEVLYGLTGGTYIWEIIKFGGNFNLWRGLILIGAGVLYLLAINQSNIVQKGSQAVLASSMIWIVGGIEILSIVLSSITGGEGAWLNTPDEFLSHYAGPFTPSLLLLPISLLLVRIIMIAGDGE